MLSISLRARHHDFDQFRLRSCRLHIIRLLYLHKSSRNACPYCCYQFCNHNPGGIESGSQTPAPSITASPTPSPSPSPSPKTPIGAIVGGVVGGLAILIAAAFGIFFLLQRKRSNAQTHAAGDPVLHPQQPQPYMQQPIKMDAVYISTDSKATHMGHPQPMSLPFPTSPPTSPPMSPVPPYVAEAAAVPAVHSHSPPPSGMPGYFHEAP